LVDDLVGQDAADPRRNEYVFSYANQLGARQGAGAVYLSAHHPDIMKFLDTKRENADEKIRIKTLSLGVVVPDITFELAKNGEDMYLFSPYDVERVYGVPFGDISVTEKYREMVDDPRIKKSKINAREFFQTLAEIQFESGYPYIMFEDTVNRANPIKGRINMSNLCSEILQVNTPTTYNEDLLLPSAPVANSSGGYPRCSRFPTS
jgi:ribonucleoside-diphosphate reductase alpha chain